VLDQGLIMTKPYLLAGIAASALLAASSAFATNLVSDGDFSSPYGGPGFTTYFNGQSFGPWNVQAVGGYSNGGVDLIGGYWQAPNSVPGTDSVDLDGDNPGLIFQTVSWTAGDTYKLSFDLSGNPDGGPSTKTVLVEVGNAFNIYTYTIGSNTHSNMMYSPETLTFKASGTPDVLFESLDSNSPYGPVIGNVSLTAVPEPSIWAMMLAGFAGLGFLGFRRSREAVALSL
jgi:choice-of-anchor C domain-containing protein